MPSPSTLSTDIGTILCLVSGFTSRAFLAGIRRIYLLYLDAKPLCFVGKEHRQLIEAPTIVHPVVFAGLCPTTCTCRPLAYSCKSFYFDRSHTLFMGMVDNLPRKLMVDIFHPTSLFAPAFLDCTPLRGFLQSLATSIELSAHDSLIASIAKEARPLPTDIYDSRDFDTEVNAHDAVLLYWLRLL